MAGQRKQDRAGDPSHSELAILEKNSRRIFQPHHSHSFPNTRESK